MEDMSGKLNEILSDPKAMEQISQLAGMLGLGKDAQSAAPPAPSAAQPSPEPAANAAGLGNLAGLASSLGGMGALGGLLGGGGNALSGANGETLQAMTRLLPLLNSFQQEDDNTRLLHALRPMLGEERRKKLDEAVKIMQMLRLLPLLKNQGIL